MSAPALAEHAPAKINLALHVTGQRADGYHSLESLVVFTQAGDRVSVDLSDEDGFTVSGRYAHYVPIDGGNLVLRARDLFRGATGEGRPLSIHLEKNLPVASGIGGGSSDAAAVLRALQRLSPVEADWARLALMLGADVPMCLRARPAIARGVGEELQPIEHLPALALVLANPGIGVSTPAIFKALACRENPPLPPFRAGDRASLLAWLRETCNDLEPPALAFAPAIGTAQDALRSAGAELVRMSGSGATSFGIFASLEKADAVAATIARREPGWFVQATTTEFAR
ncbi:MAG: 4-(cytidine 5'-diphospho)-2-C-methyl-D-erythritol kinase [Methylobacterium mesophilicum]|nr:4-(cytidine 5'-diphospho)-2-C-methyl-D-erythritol kinase [Methylobacterium mesophilicum]